MITQNMPQEPIRARYYTRPDCCLCDRVEPLLAKLAREGVLAIERVDISDDAELGARYGHQIPVIELEDGTIFARRISEFRIRKAIAKMAEREMEK